MNIGLVCLAVGVSLTSGKASPQSVDTLGLKTELMRELIRYYSAWLNGMPGDPGSPEGSCSPDTGHECFGQDPDRRMCRPDDPCQEYNWLNEIIEDLKTGAREHPEAGWIAGYTIYTLMKYGRDLEAYEIAQGCQADEWYCSLLEGYVYQAVGRPEEADPRLRHSLVITRDLFPHDWILGNNARFVSPRLDPCRLREAQQIGLQAVSAIAGGGPAPDTWS
jgi:hypothetical protein